MKFTLKRNKTKYKIKTSKEELKIFRYSAKGANSATSPQERQGRASGRGGFFAKMETWPQSR